MINQNSSVKHCALIMAGGTGGHIFPALAIARSLQQSGWNAQWLGSSAGMENELIGKTDICLNLITISGLRGNGLKGWLVAPFVLLRAIYQAVKIVNKVKPDIVIGFGGFASGPGGVAAFLLRKPLFIHEQNAIAGMTNKLLSKLAKKSFQAFPNAFPKNIDSYTVGNPIRSEIINITKTKSKNKRMNVLIVGGSRGAKVFNQQLPKILSDLVLEEKINIFHQCGKNNIEQTMINYKSNLVNDNSNVSVTEFIDDMAEVYQWADLVICRAGALTVSEIASVGIAAVFVPYPFAVDDHQTKNALWLVEKNAALLIDESRLTDCQSKTKISQLINQPEQLETMAKNAKQMAYRNATKNIVNACETLMKDAA